MVALLRDCPSDVQSKGARLQQLALAVRHLAAQPAPSHASTLAGTWGTLAGLLAVTLAAHAPSLPDAAAAARLRAAASTVAACGMAAAGRRCGGRGPDVQAEDAALEAEVAAVLGESNHKFLKALLQPLLLPALRATLAGCASPCGPDALSSQGAIGLPYCFSVQRCTAVTHNTIIGYSGLSSEVSVCRCPCCLTDWLYYNHKALGCPKCCQGPCPFASRLMLFLLAHSVVLNNTLTY